VDKIGTYDAKLQMLAEKHGVSLINALAVLDPCTNETPNLAGNHHHYVQGLGNRWKGKASTEVCFSQRFALNSSLHIKSLI
jgi:hypothetical protein